MVKSIFLIQISELAVKGHISFSVCCCDTLSEGQNQTQNFGDLLIKVIASSLKCIMRQPCIALVYPFIFSKLNRALQLAVTHHMFEKASIMKNKVLQQNS